LNFDDISNQVSVPQVNHAESRPLLVEDPQVQFHLVDFVRVGFHPLFLFQLLQHSVLFVFSLDDLDFALSDLEVFLSFCKDGLLFLLLYLAGRLCFTLCL